jgi:primosomal protein DnaI
MKRLNLNVAPESADAQKTRLQLADMLAGDKAVQALCQRENIPMQVLQEEAYTFKRWRDNAALCLGCPGLKKCRQPRTGYCLGLRYDGLLQEVAEPCAYRRQKEKKEAHLARYLVSDLGENFAQVSFQDISLSGEPQAYIKAVRAALDLCRHGKGCYLYGPMGSGKTYLAACAANYTASSGGSVAFVHSPAFHERVGLDRRNREYESEAQRMSCADLLVVDDIGAEEVTDKGRSVLLAVLDARMAGGRMTWFTSNLDFASLEQHFMGMLAGDDRMMALRLMERIRALAQPVFVDHADRRKLFGASE